MPQHLHLKWEESEKTHTDKTGGIVNIPLTNLLQYSMIRMPLILHNVRNEENGNATYWLIDPDIKILLFGD